MKQEKIIPLSIITSLFVLGLLYLMVLLFPAEATVEKEPNSQSTIVADSVVLYEPTTKELKLLNTLLYTYRTIPAERKNLIDPALYKQLKKAQRAIKKQKKIKKSTLKSIFYQLKEVELPEEETLSNIYFRILLAPTIQFSQKKLAYSPLSSKKPIVLQTKTFNKPALIICEAVRDKVHLKDASRPLMYYEKDEWLPLEKAFKAIGITLIPTQKEKLTAFVYKRNQHGHTSLADAQRLLYSLHLPTTYATCFIDRSLIRLNEATDSLEIRTEVGVEEKTSITGKNILFQIQNPYNTLVAPFDFKNYNPQTKTESTYQLVSFLAPTPQRTVVFYREKQQYYWWENGQKKPLSLARFKYYLAKARVLHYQNKQLIQQRNKPRPFGYIQFWETYLQPLVLIGIPLAIGYFLRDLFEPTMPKYQWPKRGASQDKGVLVSSNSQEVIARGIVRGGTNNCYANTILQLLALVTKGGFFGRVIKKELEEEIQKIKEERKKYPERITAFNQKMRDLRKALKTYNQENCSSLIAFLQRLWGGPSTRAEPRAFVEDIKEKVWKKAESGQQDADEFFRITCNQHPVVKKDCGLIYKREFFLKPAQFPLKHNKKEPNNHPLSTGFEYKVSEDIVLDGKKEINIENPPKEEPSDEKPEKYKKDIIRIFKAFDLQLHEVHSKVYKIKGKKEQEIFNALKNIIKNGEDKKFLNDGKFELETLVTVCQTYKAKEKLMNSISCYLDESKEVFVAKISNDNLDLVKNYLREKVMEKQLKLSFEVFTQEDFNLLFSNLGFSLKQDFVTKYKTMKNYLKQELKNGKLNVPYKVVEHYYPEGKYYLLMLKRFLYNNDGSGGRKLYNEVQKIPEEIKKQDIEGNNHTYRLSAVVYHNGSIDSGHYTIARRDINDKWAFINDKYVRETTLEAIQQKRKTPYIFCYEKIEEPS